jgi:D-alanyl-D-alanine carboxypeptidase
MKHETGVPDLIEENEFYLGVLNNPNKKWSAEELLSFIYDKPKLFSPGDTAVYSNTNTTLVSLVMEYASGKKHSELLKQYLIQPLGLANTYYQPHDRLPNNVAQGYYDLYNDNTIVNVSNWITGSGNGYGGIYSNVFDLYKLIDALLLQKTLLKPSSLALMQTFGTTEDINQYGYGIMKKFIDRGVNYGLGHSGRDLGYSANLFYFPNKGVTHVFIINYGTDAKSNLRDVFYQFQNELIDMSLK